MAFILPVRMASNVAMSALITQSASASSCDTVTSPLRICEVPVLGALAVGDVEAHRARHALEQRLMLLRESL